MSMVIGRRPSGLRRGEGSSLSSPSGVVENRARKLVTEGCVRARRGSPVALGHLDTTAFYDTLDVTQPQGSYRSLPPGHRVDAATDEFVARVPALLVRKLLEAEDRDSS